MKHILNTLAAALLLMISSIAVAAANTSGFNLLKTMSVADFRTTGLDKLSDAQIRSLDDWFANYERQYGSNCGQAALARPGAASIQAAVVASPATASASIVNAPGSDIIVSRLSGTFTGWSGDTEFKLENGQIWEQNNDSILSIAAIPNPQIMITKGVFNAYYLSVNGVMGSVRVRLVKKP